MRKHRLTGWRATAVLAAAILASIALTVIVFLRTTDLNAQIQLQRHGVIMRSCQDQSARHARTVARAQMQTRWQLKAAKRNAAAFHMPVQTFRALIVQGEHQTIALIDALAPVQDCQRLAALATRHR